MSSSERNFKISQLSDYNNINLSKSDWLRELAFALDLHLGVSNRKLIMQGNEKLSENTNESTWNDWRAESLNRICELADRDTLKKVINRLNSSISESR